LKEEEKMIVMQDDLRLTEARRGLAEAIWRLDEARMSLEMAFPIKAEGSAIPDLSPAQIDRLRTALDDYEDALEAEQEARWAEKDAVEAEQR
jgi:hypothetical protein